MSKEDKRKSIPEEEENDEEEEDEEEEEEENVNTDGEIEESADVEAESSSSSSEDESSERPLVVSADTERETFVKKMVEVAKQAEDAERQKAEKEKAEKEKAEKEKEVTVSQVEAPKGKTAKTAAPRRKTGGGIKRQSKKWEEEAKAQNVSRMAFLEGIYNKFNALTNTHKALTESFDALNSKHLNAKNDREERDMAKASLKAKEKELAQAQSKIAALEGRLSFTLEEMGNLKAQLHTEKAKNLKEKDKRKAMIKEHQEKELERAMNDVQVLEMHIPSEGDRISDKVLVYDTDQDSERPCYTFAGKNCLHLNVKRIGNKISVRGFNWGRKRSPVEEAGEPAAQRARFSP